MAKAGLFIPVDNKAELAGDPSDSQHENAAALGDAPSAGPSNPANTCRMFWFDLILADIGDAQSLQQNLSTFSGHIRRIKAILASATSRSLVLLDEVGLRKLHFSE